MTLDDAIEIHKDQLRLFGGTPGIKDLGLVDSAISAPRNLYLYEDVTDVLELGVRLAFAIGQNHGFVDGNKRTAAAAMIESLAINGFALMVPDDNPVEPTLGVWIKGLVTHNLSESVLYERLVPFVSAIDDFDQYTPLASSSYVVHRLAVGFDQMPPGQAGVIDLDGSVDG